MKSTKLIILYVLGLFSVLFFLAFKEIYIHQSPSYFEASRDSYYKNPPEAKVHTDRINIICPLLHTKVGERYMVEDLERFFKSKGKTVKTFDEAEYYQKKNFEKAGGAVNIFIYGNIPFWPNKNGINIIYLLFPSTYHKDYKMFDLVATASLKYLATLKSEGLSAAYIPQFTNIKRFYHQPREKLKSNLLFVGNSYRTFREAVKYAVLNHFKIDVYGKGWEEFISKDMIKGEFISNDKLHRYYSSADIVLNVHRGDMLQNGFISNRIFDVTASGGFMLSDYMPEIEEIYGDSVLMYRNSEDYGQIVRYYLSHPEERKQKALKAQAITMENFTVEKIGQRFLEEIDKIVQKRKAEGTIILDE